MMRVTEGSMALIDEERNCHRYRPNQKYTTSPITTTTRLSHHEINTIFSPKRENTLRHCLERRSYMIQTILVLIISLALPPLAMLLSYQLASHFSFPSSSSSSSSSRVLSTLDFKGNDFYDPTEHFDALEKNRFNMITATRDRGSGIENTDESSASEEESIESTEDEEVEVDSEDGEEYEEEESEDEYYDDDEHPTTGSHANCTLITTTSFSSIVRNNNNNTIPDNEYDDPHPDAGIVIVSCRTIRYRAPLAEIEEGGHDVVVGVLSGAGGRGEEHRDSIRSTWASGGKSTPMMGGGIDTTTMRTTNNNKNMVKDDVGIGDGHEQQRRKIGSIAGVYFLVAGPWEGIAREFEERRDLIWIDEEEKYEGEDSVLPFKTVSFMSIMHENAREYVAGSNTSPSSASGFRFLFKTDDDSYVDLHKLRDALVMSTNDNNGENYDKIDYWGKCTKHYFRPLRDPSLKWHVTMDVYPEEAYPLYCQGAGFAMSRSFVDCAVSEKHVQTFRYNPFEDVSVGLLAERCNVKPVTDTRINQYRADEGQTRMAKDGLEYGIGEAVLLPKANMALGKILQHRVKTHYDMYMHHLCSTGEVVCP